MGDCRVVETTIRPISDSRRARCGSLLLRAWTPVHDSMRDVMGDEIFGRLYGHDCRYQQRQDVEKALRDEKSEVWVVEVDGGVAGFVSAVMDASTHMGEIHMVAVDPDFQNHGLGTQLTDVATDWLRRRDGGRSWSPLAATSATPLLAAHTRRLDSRRCPPSTTSRPFEHARPISGGSRASRCHLSMGDGVRLARMTETPTALDRRPAWCRQDHPRSKDRARGQGSPVLTRRVDDSALRNDVA